MENLLACLSTVFALCFCSEAFNITFHANTSTWNEAVKYCAKIGGVLYSDDIDIRNRTDKDVWTGKYEAFTPWAITWGCYHINFEDDLKVSYGKQPECQKRCTGTDFFAIKEDKCKCLNSADLKIQEGIRPCNCSACVKVLRHRIVNVASNIIGGCKHNNTDCTCMAAACRGDRLILTPEQCHHDYSTVCNNNKNNTPRNQNAASEFCYKQYSILRWYTTHTDICKRGFAQHWTSGKREVYTFIVKYQDEDSKLNPLRCFRVKKQNDEGPEFVDCNKIFPFFCKIGDNTHEDNILENGESQSNSAAGIIGGTISAILIISVIGVISFFLYKRRKTSKAPEIRNISSQDNPPKFISNVKENNSGGQYHDIDIAAVGYSVAKPLPNNHTPTTKITGEINEYNDMRSKDRSDEDNSRTHPEVDKMNVSEYDMAKPITDTEELDLYTTNTDYDHLNNVKKQEMSDMKVYDHLKNATESDPTYDHAGVTVKEETENYEHFNVEK